MRRLRFVSRTILALAVGALGTTPAALYRSAEAQTSKPNILLFILDDVGIDQLTLFNNGGLLPPATPNINLIAGNGVRFSNVWAMPECSPSRAAIFTGRYPVHNGVEAALMENHLPQSYVSSFEATLPRVLTKAGYTNALFGKYHLGDEQDPAGTCAPSTRGWQTFSGAMTAGPPSIDKTAGGIDNTGSQVCGYFQTSNAGACYTVPNGVLTCGTIDGSNSDPNTTPARTCLQHGGIFVPNQACGVGAPLASNFNMTNGYYVWPRTTLSGVRDPLFAGSCPAVIDRTYLTEAQSNDGVSWWGQQSGPRMMTVSYNAIHTPIQKAPTTIVPDPTDNNAATCSSSQPARTELNNMLEGIDVEIGRTLAGLGLATMGPNGRVLTSLNLQNTVVVIIGDNGSQGPAVRIGSGFDPTRAKTTVYQTGVWVPLIIAGPVVSVPNREVSELVNAADLFQLFGDLAGVKVGEIVPPSHALDSMPLLPYLTNPATPPIRTLNFTQEGAAIFSPVPSERSWPCQVGNLCNDTLFNTKGFCEDNGGVWWGPGGAQQVNSCCAVQTATNTTLSIAPAHQLAVRNRNFKLVELQKPNCSAPVTDPSQKAFPWADYQMVTVQELYDIRSTQNNPNGVDFAQLNLAQSCAQGQDLTTCVPTSLDAANYRQLNAELQRIKNSATAQNACQAKGDGNLDMRVTQADVLGWQAFNGKGPSRYDINLDGQTDSADLAIIQANLGLDCLNACVRADLNRDGKIDASDVALLNAQRGTCSDAIFCSGDLNGDGVVNDSDAALMTNQLGVTCTASTNVLSAVLPASRSVRVANVASAFSTIINASTSTGSACKLSLDAAIPATFHYQTTNPATNALTGGPDTPVDIPAGGSQSFVFAVTPTGPFDSVDVPITAGCSNLGTAAIVTGLNTLLLSASASPVPDIVVIAASVDPGYVDLPGNNGNGAFAAAATNVGIGGALTVSADTGAATLPVTINVCQTNASAQCINPPIPAPTANVTINANDTPTFSVFVSGNGAVANDPAHNRVFLRFKDAGGVTRGATSVAVRTQ